MKRTIMISECIYNDWMECYVVKLTPEFYGGTYSTHATISTKFKTIRGDGLHWLLEHPPISSERLKECNDMISKAFVNWKPSMDKINIEL